MKDQASVENLSRRKSDLIINSATSEDHGAIVALYRTVAAIEGGLARTAAEISDEYVTHFLSKSLAGGIILVARESAGDPVIGEIHSYPLGPRVFSHVLGELTIAVHPSQQGLGVGKTLFAELLRCVEQERQDILRVELIARESNRKAIEFYQKLGFQIEGRMEGRIRSVGSENNGYEADIPMAWHRAIA